MANVRDIPGVALDLSEWSQKFYNGTFKWDAEGFTDDKGVYRNFDCYDPLARAPTPLPPILLDDEEGEYATEDRPTTQETPAIVDEVVLSHSDELAVRQHDVLRLPFGNWSKVKIGSNASDPFFSTSDRGTKVVTDKIRNDSIFSSESDHEVVTKDTKSDDGVAPEQEMGASSPLANHGSLSLPQATAAAGTTDKVMTTPTQTPGRVDIFGKGDRKNTVKHKVSNVLTTPNTTKVMPKV
ncbi:hypothetical protein T440DRAFT_71296 [Plenodomus tracheiphilus IPT5]|uniref:Uncharacterized protein n=1 Tax=Plenodomus tracheiphilus IPT5 TaxID=1408161 RepID=A0A6A7BA50_9PLEO|nr:hypothetical protein T440DRAFT_71296 [Plenodomus tracheiphilus IPT5]